MGIDCGCREVSSKDDDVYGYGYSFMSLVNLLVVVWIAKGFDTTLKDNEKENRT